VYVFEAGYTGLDQYAKYEAYKDDQATKKLVIVKKLMEQLEMVSTARFLVCDMKPSNIVVKISDNSVDVRFIDFDPMYTIPLTPDVASTHCVRLLNTMLLCNSSGMNMWFDVYKFFAQPAAATLNELWAKSYTPSSQGSTSADLCMLVKKVKKERIMEMETTTIRLATKDNLIERAVFTFWFMIKHYSYLYKFLFDDDYKRKRGIQDETETISLMEIWRNHMVQRFAV
jgi:hypothetical protein